MDKTQTSDVKEEIRISLLFIGVIAIMIFSVWIGISSLDKKSKERSIQNAETYTETRKESIENIMKRQERIRTKFWLPLQEELQKEPFELESVKQATEIFKKEKSVLRSELDEYVENMRYSTDEQDWTEHMESVLNYTELTLKDIDKMIEEEETSRLIQVQQAEKLVEKEMEKAWDSKFKLDLHYKN